jgi:hypothetical protein
MPKSGDFGALRQERSIRPLRGSGHLPETREKPSKHQCVPESKERPERLWLGDFLSEKFEEFRAVCAIVNVMEHFGECQRNVAESVALLALSLERGTVCLQRLFAKAQSKKTLRS